MLNDYCALSYLNTNIDKDKEFFLSIIRSYKHAGVKKINFLLHYDTEDSPEVNLLRSRIKQKEYASLHKGVPFIESAFLMPLIPELPELLNKYSELTYRKQYVFISPTVTGSRDEIAAVLHSVLYNNRLAPVLTSFEKAPYTLNKSVLDTLLSIPDAIYQINIASLQSKETDLLVKSLIRNGKFVVFGSGDRFDSNAYGNVLYYERILEKLMGKQKFGYYSLLQGKLL